MDGGKTWKNIGLNDSRHIGAVIVDPRNPDIVFVAALGHAFGPNAERGHLPHAPMAARPGQKVLYKDENTGAHRCRVRSHNSEHRLLRVAMAGRCARRGT